MGTPSKKRLEEYGRKLDTLHPEGATEDEIKNFAIEHVLRGDRDDFYKYIKTT